MLSKKFHRDLESGHRGEDKAVELLIGEFPTMRAVYKDKDKVFKPYDLTDDYGNTFEVKAELRKSRETGNVAIEWESYKKPSGIVSTQAKEWFHFYYLEGKWVYTRCQVSDLRYYIAWKQPKSKRGGDDNESMMYIIKATDFAKELGYTVFA